MIRTSTRVLIIENKDWVRDNLRIFIGNLMDFVVTNAHSKLAVAMKTIQRERPELILMGMDSVASETVDDIKQIKKSLPDSSIIVIIPDEDSDLVYSAICAGATGYITENADRTSIYAAIKDTVNGGAPMSSKMARMLVESLQKNHNSPLSERETEVLELMAKGRSYSTIADDLDIHKETVKSHIKNIYFKLQVNSKADAIEKAIKEKLI